MALGRRVQKPRGRGKMTYIERASPLLTERLCIFMFSPSVLIQAQTRILL